MSTGYITVKVFTAEKAIPIQRAQIRIIDLRIALDQTLYTDQYGNAERIKVYAPEKETSMKPQDISLPYETYNIEVVKDGYIPTTINNVPVFPGEISLQPVAMMPQPRGPKFANLVNNFELPPNGLLLKGEKQPSSAPEKIPSQTKPVFIPEVIRVHLGEPGSDDKTVLVPFADYVKNVASSEIYATWPKESLRANIFAIISYALNRIYSGFYSSKGYNYDITADPNNDPFYVDGRNIYGNINDLVNEIFNEYIRRIGFNEPLLANYCNGITTRCEGLSQWGSVTLANQGKKAEDIIKYYYGNVQLQTTNDIKGVEKNYPGKLLRLGDIGENVMTIQKQLNQIGKTYNNIPDIPVENGNFDAYTQDALRAFQKQFNLAPDGIVGKKTWYQLAFVYNAAKRLLELSKSRQNITVPETAPNVTLKEGDEGSNVRLLQYLLNAVSIFYNSVFPVDENGTFDKITTDSVKSFQKTFSIPQTGTADAATWDALLNVYWGINDQVGAVLDLLEGEQPQGIEKRPTQSQQGGQPSAGQGQTQRTAPPMPMGTTGPGAGAEGRGETGPEMGAGSGSGMQTGEAGPETDRQRVSEAMNYANGVYPFSNRGQINMAYSSDILDYIPDTYPGTASFQASMPGDADGQAGSTRDGAREPGTEKSGMHEMNDQYGISRGGKLRTQTGGRGGSMPGGKTGGMQPKSGSTPQGGYSNQMYTPGTNDGQTGTTKGGAGKTQSGGRSSGMPGGQTGGIQPKAGGTPQGSYSYQMYTPGMTDGQTGITGGVTGRSQSGGEMREDGMTGGQTGGMQPKAGTATQGTFSYIYTPGMDDDETGLIKDGAGKKHQEGKQVQEDDMMDNRTGISRRGTRGTQMGGPLHDNGMTDGKFGNMPPKSDGMQTETPAFQMYNPWIVDDQAGGMQFGSRPWPSHTFHNWEMDDETGDEERSVNANTQMEPFDYTPWMTETGSAGQKTGGSLYERQAFDYYYEPADDMNRGRGMQTDSMRGMQTGPTSAQPGAGMQTGPTAVQPGAGTQQGPTGMPGQRMRMPGGMTSQPLGQIYQTRPQPGVMSGMPQERMTEPQRTGTSDEMECPPLPVVNPPFQNKPLKIGSKGKDVQLMQEYLSYIALSLMRYKKITNELKVVVNDGIYGIDTTDAVIRFQNRYDMPVNGVIDAPTWAKIVEVYNTPCD